MSKSKLVIICLLVALDAAIRAVVRTSLLPGQSISLVGNIIQITFVPNYSGFSWWVPQLPSWAKVVYQVLLIFLLIVAFPVYLFYKQTRRQPVWMDLAFVCIVSAFLGHLLGDLSQPYTTDFVRVFHSPSANLADIYATIGIGSLIIEMYQVSRIRKTREKGLRSFLAGMLATRKEFIQFVKSGFRRSGND